MRMTAGYGGVPLLGWVMVVVSMIDRPPTVTFTVSLLPEKVADTWPAVGGGFVPSSHFWICALISARRQRQSARLVMRPPPSFRNGSGNSGIDGSALNAGKLVGTGQSAPVFSSS
jgi:hypothetical protein